MTDKLNAIYSDMLFEEKDIFTDKTKLLPGIMFFDDSQDLVVVQPIQNSPRVVFNIYDIVDMLYLAKSLLNKECIASIKEILSTEAEDGQQTQDTP